MADEIINELLALLVRISLQDLYGRVDKLKVLVDMNDSLRFKLVSDEVNIEIVENENGVSVYGKIDESLVPFEKSFKIGTVYDLMSLENYLEHELTAIC